VDLLASARSTGEAPRIRHRPDARDRAEPSRQLGNTVTATSEPLWGPQDVSDYLGVPVPTLYQWRRKGYGPAARRVGKHLRWDPDAVRAWVDRQTG
jgi:excisionase family DNA binding protein